MNRLNAWGLIMKELDYQVEKWDRPDGCWPEDLHKKNTVLGEEVGEVANAILENDMDNLKIELAQVAAVCVSILMSEFPSPRELHPSNSRREEQLGHKGGRGWYHE